MLNEYEHLFNEFANPVRKAHFTEPKNGKDQIWGVGLYANDDRILTEANWRGQNRLGKVLMRVRQVLSESKG